MKAIYFKSALPKTALSVGVTKLHYKPFPINSVQYCITMNKRKEQTAVCLMSMCCSVVFHSTVSKHWGILKGQFSKNTHFVLRCEFPGDPRWRDFFLDRHRVEEWPTVYPHIGLHVFSGCLDENDCTGVSCSWVTECHFLVKPHSSNSKRTVIFHSGDDVATFHTPTWSDVCLPDCIVCSPAAAPLPPSSYLGKHTAAN